VPAALLVAAAACGGGGGIDGEPGCDGSCSQAALSALDVETVVAQAVAEAERLGTPATVAVVDRVGNVLAVFRMTGASLNTVVSGGRGVTGGLEDLVVPVELAAISKAGTAAYLSSQGNAFSTRTASQIIQQNFNPGERGRPGGPLFGVQFSQLPCGDVVTSYSPANAGDRTGPRRMPLGLSADPGGLPLYADVAGGQVPVGGIGIEVGCPLLDACSACEVAGQSCDPVPGDPAEACEAQFERLYSLDLDVANVDVDLEERIASAGAAGLDAPSTRRAERIFVDGKSLRFADDESSSASTIEACADLDGAFISVPGFGGPTSCAALAGGTVLGDPTSGVRLAEFEGMEAEILVDASGAPRFPPTSGPDLAAEEVRAVLRNALAVAGRTRAQIRRPLDTPARVTIAVVGQDGMLLGLVRSPDAPVFGIDVSVQKARAAAFFSSPAAGAELTAASAPVSGYATELTDFLTTQARFAGEPIAPGDVLDGSVAYAARTIGNLARPFFPDGINGRANGPLSNSFPQWSPFSTGLQLELVLPALADALCNGAALDACSSVPGLANGIQIFPGSVPIYRGTDLAGGVGVSGDGVDQDDLIAFLGLHLASVDLAGTIENAPRDARADNLSVASAHLRYVGCPVLPFIGSDDQGACDGL
jgi:uncharacterized protein GlcG (DUF336 family)